MNAVSGICTIIGSTALLLILGKIGFLAWNLLDECKTRSFVLGSIVLVEILRRYEVY